MLVNPVIKPLIPLLCSEWSLLQQLDLYCLGKARSIELTQPHFYSHSRHGMHQNQSHQGSPHTELLRGGTHCRGGHSTAMRESGTDTEKTRREKVTCSHTGTWSELTIRFEIISEQNLQWCVSSKVKLCFQLKVQGTDSATLTVFTVSDKRPYKGPQLENSLGSSLDWRWSQGSRCLGRASFGLLLSFWVPEV